MLIKGLFAIAFWGCVILSPQCVSAQSALDEDAPVVIETEIDAEVILKQRQLNLKPKPAASQMPAQEEKEELMLKKGELKETDLIQINKNLKNIIEENEKLRQKSQALSDELRNLKGQRAIEVNRLNTLMIERDAYKQQTKDVSAVKERVLEYAEQRENEMREREQFLAETIKSLETKLTDLNQEKERKEKEVTLAKIGKAAAEGKTDSIDLMEMINTYTSEKDKLRTDEAKVHYNMGNVFFEQGKYTKAVKEYKKAVSLMPEDPFAHFNLAYVSSEYMFDHTTALEHYRQYLFLNPQAEDARLVREKILEAELHIRGRIDSGLEKEYRRDKNELYRN